VRPVHVAGYIEELGQVRKAPTVKQHLACTGDGQSFLVAHDQVYDRPNDDESERVRLLIPVIGPGHTLL
jgi:hypothetical protein